jgi:transposase
MSGLGELEVLQTITDNMENVKKKQAYILYVEHDLDAKEVARIVGVSERTIWRWNKKENWRNMRSIRALAPAKLASFYYQQSEVIMQTAVKEKRLLTDKEVAIISKLSATVMRLEKGDGVGFNIRAMDNFLAYLSKNDLQLAKSIGDHQLQFLKKLQRGPSCF